MKRNIISGIMLISALALGSCSTTKLASNQTKQDDDVYFSNAKAGDQVEYVASTQPAQTQQNRYNNYNDDDYYFYDSYASRINRFGYFSPFSYYNDIYYGYSPYSYYNSPYYGGLSIGFGYGYGGGYSSYYSPYYGFGYGYGYNSYGYNYFGTGYGYGGGGGYWGNYSAYGNGTGGTARPYRAQMPNTPTATNRSTGRIGYNGSYPTEYMGRPQRINGTNSQATRTTSTSGARSQTGDAAYSRPQRPVDNTPQQRPTYQPQPVSSSPPSSSNTSSGDGGRSSNSGGGGGGRPVRP